MAQYDRSNRSFVIRTSRMSAHQRNAYREMHTRYCVPLDRRPVDFDELFPHRRVHRGRPVVLELGFGMGDSLATMAQNDPSRDFVGVEVHRPGVGKLMGNLSARGIVNVRIIELDAVEVLSSLVPPASLSALHVFFPDPWPKKRHKKRRLIREGFPEMVRHLLAPKGYVYLVTDWPDYSEQMKAVFDGSPFFENRYGGFAERAEWRPTTAFEKKAWSAGRAIFELMYQRVSS